VSRRHSDVFVDGGILAAAAILDPGPDRGFIPVTGGVTPQARDRQDNKIMIVSAPYLIILPG
jgi:hypothetical protein